MFYRKPIILQKKYCINKLCIYFCLKCFASCVIELNKIDHSFSKC